MLTKRAFLKWTGVALAALSIQSGSHTAGAREPLAPLVVVVARNSPIERLSRFELKKLYLGANLQAPGGERVIAFHQLYSAPDRVAFERGVLGMDPEELTRYWIDRKIRGEGGAPRVVGSAELLQRVVSHISQSVGYVRLDQVGPELRVIPIDGRLPGDAGYSVTGAEEGSESFAAQRWEETLFAPDWAG
jgi:hypothetical protein